jgi:hypothetical protein
MTRLRFLNQNKVNIVKRGEKYMYINVLTPKKDEKGKTMKQKTVQVTKFAFEHIYAAKGYEIVKEANKEKEADKDE